MQASVLGHPTFNRKLLARSVILEGRGLGWEGGSGRSPALYEVAAPQERATGRKFGEQNPRDKDSKNRDQEMSNKGALFRAVSFVCWPGDSYCPQCAYFDS